jgi:GT2 family glycosyltransferase
MVSEKACRTDFQAEVTAIVVTHNSARYLEGCLGSLHRQGIEIQLILVDNASHPEERPVFRGNTQGEIILNRVNRGFAAAVNQALMRARAPYILLLNPDVCLMPDTLNCLRAFLVATPQAAAVSPRLWWDLERSVLLPPTAVPTLTRLVLRALAARSCVLCKVLDRFHIREARRWWFAREAIEVGAISAACVLISTRALERVGPLDVRFPFYYEEVEWSLRARRGGYGLFVLPAAEAVHWFSHSHREGSRRVERWAKVSARRYWLARYGRLGAWFSFALSARQMSTGLATVDNLGIVMKPPCLTWSTVARPQVLEVAFDPWFGSAAAIFPAYNEFRWPVSLWDEMPAGTYHARLLCGSPLRPAQQWLWSRAVDPRDS